MTKLELWAAVPLQQVQLQIPGLPTTAAGADTLRNVLSVVFAVAGALAVLYILIGAARYATATGDSGQLKQARDTILYAIVGLIVALSGFFIVQFVLGSITNP